MYFQPTIPKLRKIFLLFCVMVFATLSIGCSGRKVLEQRVYRIASPEFAQMVGDSSLKAGIYSDWNAEVVWASQCDSCYNLSKWSLQFELNSRLDSLLRLYFGAWERVELIRGVGIPEDDFAGDTLLLQLQNDSVWNWEVFAQRKEALLVWNEKVPPHIRSLVAQAGVRYDVDLLVTPLKLDAKAWPDEIDNNNGVFEGRMMWVLWDVSRQIPLYLLQMRVKVRARGKQSNLDRDWTLEWTDQFGSDWQKLLGTTHTGQK